MLPYFRSMEAFFNLSLPKSWADLSEPQLLFFFRQLATDKPMAEIQTLCLCHWANILVRCRLYGSVYLVQHDKQQATLTLRQFVCAITAPLTSLNHSYIRLYQRISAIEFSILRIGEYPIPSIIGIVNSIRLAKGNVFAKWKNSDTAKLFEDYGYKNKKECGGYFF